MDREIVIAVFKGTKAVVNYNKLLSDCNTHNITSLIRTPQVCISHFADGRSLHGVRV